MNNLTVEWIDHRREPRCPPNPLFPKGIDLDASAGAKRSCQIALPYPAPRCGMFIVTCKACKLTVAVTTAGRPDDPKSLRVACKTAKGVDVTAALAAGAKIVSSGGGRGGGRNV